MGFTESAQCITQVVYDLLTVLDVPSPPWSESRPLVEDWITAAGEASNLETVNIGIPEVFVHNDKINVPMLLVSPYTDVTTDRSGEWGSVKSPAYVFALEVFYVMARDDLVAGADRGSIGDIPELLALERAGALRRELSHEDNWKNLQGTTTFMTDASQPSLNNDFQNSLDGENRLKYVCASFIVPCGVAEEPITG